MNNSGIRRTRDEVSLHGSKARKMFDPNGEFITFKKFVEAPHNFKPLPLNGTFNKMRGVLKIKVGRYEEN